MVSLAKISCVYIDVDWHIRNQHSQPPPLRYLDPELFVEQSQYRFRNEGQRNQGEPLRHPLMSIRLDDAAGVARTTGTAFLEIALLVAVGILVGMNDEAAAVFVQYAQTTG